MPLQHSRLFMTLDEACEFSGLNVDELHDLARQYEFVLLPCPPDNAMGCWHEMLMAALARDIVEAEDEVDNDDKSRGIVDHLN